MLDSVSRECAVVISTCDKYWDILDPFFTLFNKFWSDNPYPVFLNSETLDYSKDNVRVTTLKARAADLSWTRRLKEALERIDAEYILFMLDDFFLYDYVDTTRIKKCITYMRKDPNIGAIYFTCFSFHTEECDLPELEKCDNTGRNKVNLTLALWRRDVFLYYLNHDESPWEFEENALERSLDRGDTFYLFSKNVPIAIPYDFVKYGLFAGKWFRETVDLFKEHGITHDFSIRGFYEKYEFGLIPYVVRQIKMDSYLVPCHFLTRDNPRIDTDKIVEEGHFTQVYDVSGAKSAAIWYPSTMQGYAIEDFKCTIVFKFGATEMLGPEDVFGGFSLYRGAMYFHRPGVSVYIFSKSKQEMSSITIEGFLNKHLDGDDLAATYGLDVRDASADFKALFGESRIYAETLIIPENYISFRVYSSLCFKYNGRYDENRAILDGKDRFPGCFLQSYKIDKSAANTVRWNIGGSLCGFAIEGLRVEMIFSDDVSLFLDPQNIKGDGVLIDGYWVFLSPIAHLLFSLPEERPDEIRISGTIMAPLPRKVLRAVIYTHDLAGADNNVSENKDRNSLINPNGLRVVLPRVRRGIKKYGVFGIVKEAIKRLFRQ